MGVLSAIQEEVFSHEALAYLIQKVAEALEQFLRHQTGHAKRRELERQLDRVLMGQERIKEAIRRGLISDITRDARRSRSKG